MADNQRDLSPGAIAPSPLSLCLPLLPPLNCPGVWWGRGKIQDFIPVGQGIQLGVWGRNLAGVGAPLRSEWCVRSHRTWPWSQAPLVGTYVPQFRCCVTLGKFLTLLSFSAHCAQCRNVLICTHWNDTVFTIEAAL